MALLTLQVMKSSSDFLVLLKRPFPLFQTLEARMCLGTESHFSGTHSPRLLSNVRNSASQSTCLDVQRHC